MQGKLSFGAKLTLRYIGVMFFTLSAFALFIYQEVERRINQNATLLLEMQAADLADALHARALEYPQAEVQRWLEEHVAQKLRETDASLDLGIAWLDTDGESIVRGGALATEGLPVPQTLLDGSETQSLRAVNLGGEYAFLAMQLRTREGFLQIVIDSKRYAENLTHIRDTLLLTLPVVLLFTGLLGWWLATRSLQPLRKITATARQISGANLSERIPTRGSGDELDQLATTLNEMIASIEHSIDVIRRFNANAAHELRTPLTAILSQVEVTLEKSRGEAEYREVLFGVRNEIHRLGECVDAMLRLAQSEAGLDRATLEDVTLNRVIKDVLDFFAPLAEAEGIHLVASPLPETTLRGDAAWLQQLFANLISNGIKYTPAGGTVCVRGELRNGGVCFSVSDTGPGIPPSESERIFDRFHRADIDHKKPGFGLGLAIAQEIARAHGGRIECLTKPSEVGTTFQVWLPGSPKSA